MVHSIRQCVIVPATADARSAAVPRFDPVKECTERARSNSGGNAMRVACLEREQDGYNRLKTIWQAASEQARSECAESQTTYSGVADCLDFEVKADAATPKFNR